MCGKTVRDHHTSHTCRSKQQSKPTFIQDLSRNRLSRLRNTGTCTHDRVSPQRLWFDLQPGLVVCVCVCVRGSHCRRLVSSLFNWLICNSVCSCLDFGHMHTADITMHIHKTRTHTHGQFHKCIITRSWSSKHMVNWTLKTHTKMQKCPCDSLTYTQTVRLQHLQPALINTQRTDGPLLPWRPNTCCQKRAGREFRVFRTITVQFSRHVTASHRRRCRRQ